MIFRIIGSMLCMRRTEVTTAEEFGRALRKMQAERVLPALILDMRDNPGGLLDAAVAVSQQLVPEGTEIVSTAGRVYGEGTTLSYRSTKPPMLSPRTRLVVLVNSNTASAAEIVSGVVQDTDRGVIVGERTFGKGLVQIVEPLPGGGSLKLTVAKYYTCAAANRPRHPPPTKPTDLRTSPDRSPHSE